MWIQRSEASKFNNDLGIKVCFVLVSRGRRLNCVFFIHDFSCQCNVHHEKKSAISYKIT